MISIQELAMKHILRHPNDKSNSILAKMNRQFGAKAAQEAILEARKVLYMVDPEHPESYWSTVNQEQKFNGRKIEFIIFDDYPMHVINNHSP